MGTPSTGSRETSIRTGSMSQGGGGRGAQGVMGATETAFPGGSQDSTSLPSPSDPFHVTAPHNPSDPGPPLGSLGLGLSRAVVGTSLEAQSCLGG